MLLIYTSLLNKTVESTFNRHVKPTLGKMKIGLRDAQSKAKVDASLLNPRIIKKIINNLRAIFNWAIKDKNPVFIGDIIKTDRNEAGRVLSDAELDKLWSLDEFQVKPRLLVFLNT